MFSQAYSAGVYDAVSALASVAARTGRISSTALVATAACLDQKGETMGEFSHWAARALLNARLNDSAAEAIIASCVPGQ